MGGFATKTKHPYISLPDGWDDGFRAALGQVSSRLVGVTTVGDSFAQGAGSSDVFANNWPARIRAGLLGRNLPLGGDYYPCVHADDSFIQAGNSYRYGPTPPPWVVSATSRSYFQSPFGWFPMYTDTGVANKLVYTDPDARTEHDILMLNYAALSGAWTWNLDGGADQAVNTVAGQTFGKVALPSASNAAHTINIGNQTVSQRMFIAGMCAYKSRSAGLFFANCGQTGRSLGALLNGTIPTDQFLPLGGWQGAWPGTLGLPAAPDLFIFGFGINDCQSNTAGQGPLTFKRALLRMVRVLRRANPNVAILLIIHNLPDLTYSDSTSAGLTNTLDWPLYEETMYQVAREQSCAVFNVAAKWGLVAVASGYQTNSEFHPTDAGHQNIADTILSAL